MTYYKEDTHSLESCRHMQDPGKINMAIDTTE